MCRRRSRRARVLDTVVAWHKKWPPHARRPFKPACRAIQSKLQRTHRARSDGADASRQRAHSSGGCDRQKKKKEKGACMWHGPFQYNPTREKRACSMLAVSLTLKATNSRCNQSDVRIQGHAQNQLG